MELFPFLRQPDQDEKQSDAGSDLYGSHSGIACRAGHGQFKHRRVDHRQLNKVFVPHLDTALMDRLCQKLVPLRCPWFLSTGKDYRDTSL